MPVTPTTAAQAPKGIDLAVVAARADRLADDLAAAGVTDSFAAGAGFTGAALATLLVPGSGGADRLLVGLGAAEEVDGNRLRAAAGAAARAARRHARVAVTLADASAGGTTAPEAARALAEGWILGAYRYTAMKSAPEADRTKSVVLTTGGSKPVKHAVALGVRTAEAVAFARDLVNAPGGTLRPADFAAQLDTAGRAAGLTVKVLEPAAITRRKLGGLLAVAQGSANPPRFVELHWKPPGAKARVALVGKGVTFDSGGLSLKSTDGMKGMNGDMGGAAAMAGAMLLAPFVAPDMAVSAYLPLVENMPGPDALRVGDVFTARGGTTVEVLNTDAEGRLILADALGVACESKPDAVIDAATLTGACMVALGTRTAGIFGSDESLVDHIRATATHVGESMWPMPMPDHLRRGLDSDVADIKNIGNGRYGGASVAAVFLREFVADHIAWAHLDIAGPAWESEGPWGEVNKGGTGFGVRTLAGVLADWSPLR